METKLLIDDVELNIGYELLETIADRMGDSPDFAQVYHKLAQSKNPEVRYAISYYDNLMPETMELLLEDSEDKVIERLLNSSERIAKVPEELLRNIILKRGSTDILKAISSNFEYIDTENPVDFLKLVVKKSIHNYSILGDIADNWSCPKPILKQLAKHSDPDISRKAKERLNS
jgi:hypothetical protein